MRAMRHINHAHFPVALKQDAAVLAEKAATDDESCCTVNAEDERYEHMKMSYRYRLRCLLYCCTVCVILVFVFVNSPTVTSDEYGRVYIGKTTGRTIGFRTIDSGRPHFHRAGEARNCEIVDVAISVGGQESCNQAALLIKSILLFRRSPIRLHLLVDPPSRHVMGTLLRTWHVYGLEFHLYTVKSTSKQFGGGYDSLVHLLEFLPPSVERVISLQSDILVSADVYQLWNVFTDMGEKKSAFGLVCNSKLNEFRSEVFLIDLKRTRQLVRDQHSKSGSKILSSLYQQDRALFFPLSHGWSVHREDKLLQVNSEQCQHQQTTCVHSSIGSSNLKTKIQDYDGNYLREKWIKCRTGPSFDQDAINYREKTRVFAHPCTDFKREGNQDRRTHPFYAGQWLDPQSNLSYPMDVTLVLHVTVDRLVTMLEPMCMHWEGPMSIAVFANDFEVSGLLDLIHSSPLIRARQNIAYHVVYKEGVNMYYPINPLRLVAVENVGTEYVFLNDMDFLPSFGLYSYLMKTVKEFNMTREVLVIPAFETYEDPKSFVFPKDKLSLMKLVSQNKVFQFHRSQYIRGHAPTDYPRWEKAIEPYEIQWQPQYEPYLVTSRNITPHDARFVSRDFNKVSHTEQLYYQRYKFYALSGGFILHLPHQLSSDAKQQRESDRHRECYSRRMEGWRTEMAEQYGYEPYLVDLYKIWNRLSSSYDTSL